jgi:Co/Zn/Cd efflux system component
MADECCSAKAKEFEVLVDRGEQRRVLVAVLAINALMFVVEFGAGLTAGSSALMADSVDNLGDAIVYALSLFALARGARWEAAAALTKGTIILAFGVAVIVEVGVKIAYGVPPSSKLMLIFGGLALAANLSCVAMLWRFRRLNVNMSSTFECSRNDVISNLGVLIAAVLIAATGSTFPDIVGGGGIAVLFLRSALRVLRDAWPAWKAADPQRS